MCPVIGAMGENDKNEWQSTCKDTENWLIFLYVRWIAFWYRDNNKNYVESFNSVTYS